MKFYENAALWHWKYYTVPADFELEENLLISGGITLADGSFVQGEKFSFSEDYQIDFSGKITQKEKIIVVGNFISDHHGTLFAGMGIGSRWTFRFNGKMMIDASVICNNEYPLQADNHISQLDYLPGRNQVIFEIFGNPADMLMIFKVMKNIPFLSIKYGPFLSFPDSSENAVSVIFSANRNTPAAVDYRKKGTDEWNRVYDNLGGQMRHDRLVHHIRLSDLEPDSEYEYRTVLVDEYRGMKELTGDEIFTFRTLPQDRKSFSFLLSADLQYVDQRPAFLEKILGKSSPFHPDFFAFAGDLFWTSNYDRSVMEEFIEPFRKITGNGLPLVMVRGNHEIYGKESNRYFDYFTPPCEGKEGYYMFRCGTACFIVLDFGDDAGRMPQPSTRQFHDLEPYLAAEAKWLKKAVELPICKEAEYRIVLAHGIPLGDPLEYMPSHVRRMIDPVFGGANPEVKIHLWIGGHVHRPFRSIPRSNSCYSLLDPAEFPAVHPKIGERYQFPVVVTGGPLNKVPGHFCFTSIYTEVTPDGITVRSYDRENQEYDSFRIAPDGTVTDGPRSDLFRKYDY